MKYRVTLEMSGTSINQVVSRLMASFYTNDIDVDWMDAELLAPTKDDLEFLAENGVPEDVDHEEVFHFPRTRELLNYLNPPRD